MTRMRKAIYLDMKGEKIKWHYYQGPNQGRIFFDEINGETFKCTPADQKKANKIIDEMFAEFDEMFAAFNGNN